MTDRLSTSAERTSLRVGVSSAALLAALVGCGGGESGGPAGPSATSADFVLTCAPSSFSGLRCGSGTCSIASTGGFSGQVRLSCASPPAGVTCGFGPNPQQLSANATARTGFTVSVDPGTLAGQTRLRVVASAGGLDRSFEVSVGGSPAPPATSRGVFRIFGCAGYTPGIPNRDSLQAFTSTFVGAWRTPNPGPNGGFCAEVLGEPDGSFVLDVGVGCVPEGGNVYLSSGGLHGCVAVPYDRGARIFAEVLGRRDSEACP